ncbi:MAG: hypothetical protein HUU14_12150, partial [Dehalococcoidia bacterium]|nr:hypothetical protein [Dehalococcoidia bacterium]
GTRDEFVGQIVTEAYEEMGKPTPVKRERSANRASSVSPALDIPTAPFWGAKTISYMPLEIVYDNVTPEVTLVKFRPAD